MTYLRAFLSGIFFPTILAPIVVYTAIALDRPQILGIPFIHLIPVLWGIWNMLYVALCTYVMIPFALGTRYWLSGAILGLLIAIYGVFWLQVPAILDFPPSNYYYPLVGAPIGYSIVFRFVVKPLNELLGIQI